MTGPAVGQPPLRSYRVVDFGTAWAGPMAAQLLADLGAEVIKVESRARMDGLRLGRPIVGEDIAGGDRGLWPDLQPVFHGINRNKLSVTLNLKTEEGLALVRRLIAASDVVMNNYSPGVLERLGPVLSRPVPAASRHHPGLHAVGGRVGAAAGHSRLRSHHPGPVRVDEPGGVRRGGTAGGRAAGAVERRGGGDARRPGGAGGLRHRNLTGQGQFAEVAQLEATTSMLGEGLLDYQMTGSLRPPLGNYDPDFAPTTTTAAPETTSGSPSPSGATRSGRASAGRWGIRRGHRRKVFPRNRTG